MGCAPCKEKERQNTFNQISALMKYMPGASPRTPWYLPMVNAYCTWYIMATSAVLVMEQLPHACREKNFSPPLGRAILLYIFIQKKIACRRPNTVRRFDRVAPKSVVQYGDSEESHLKAWCHINNTRYLLLHFY